VNVPDDKPSTVDPYSGNHAESIYAVWHDPTTYDHLKMGPPYLPGMGDWKAAGRPKQASEIPDSASLAEVRALVAKAAGNEEIANTLAHFLLDYGQHAFAELGALLTCLRALNMLHQTHHWQTRGPNFLADHHLFEQLYNETLPLVDQLAERAVGLGSPVIVNPVIQATHQLLIIKGLCNGVALEPTPDQLVLISLNGVLRFLVLHGLAYNLLEKKGQLTHGLDNLLQGIADRSEVFLYLLKQRAAVQMPLYNAGQKTAADWKV
jgi:hypothetical protein